MIGIEFKLYFVLSKHCDETRIWLIRNIFELSERAATKPEESDGGHRKAGGAFTRRRFQAGSTVRFGRCVKLRCLVDEWLATGIGANGQEYPEDRRLSKTRDATIAIRSYAEAGGAKIVVTAEGHLDCQLADPAGTVEYGPAFENEVNRVAVSELLKILNSNWGERLYMCRYSQCGGYFVRQNAGRVYVNGMFCRRHQQLEKAKECSRAKRKRVQMAMIDWAAKALVSKRLDEAWSRNARQVEAVAREVTRTGHAKEEVEAAEPASHFCLGQAERRKDRIQEAGAGSESCAADAAMMFLQRRQHLFMTSKQRLGATR